MKELCDLNGWKIEVNLDLSAEADLDGYMLFLSQGDKKDYLIMLIAEDESGELFYSPRSKRILEDRSYSLYDEASESLTSLGSLCIEYGVFTRDEIIKMSEKRRRMNKDIRLLFLKRKIELFEDMVIEMPSIKKEYETLKNS